MLAHSLAAFLPTGMGLEAPLVEQAECSSRAPSGTSDGSKARPKWCLQLLLPPSGRSDTLQVSVNSA